MPPFVFISYSRNDLAFVQQLARFLTDRGLTVWFDVESLSTGDRWESQIRANVEACASMIVVMSPAAAESIWVGNEVNLALNLRKPVFPLLLAGEPLFSLGHLQFEDVRGGRLPGDAYVEKLRHGRATQASVGATNAVRRPYYFDGTSFFEPGELIGRMQQRWELALDHVAGGQADTLDRWLSDEVRDSMLPTNVLRYGSGDERLARLAAHFRADQPPVFRSRTVDLAGLAGLARQTWEGDSASASIFGAVTTGLLEIFARHEHCADLGGVAATMRSALEELTGAYGEGALPAPGLRVDLLPITATPRADSEALRVSAGLVAILFDGGFASAVESEIAGLSEIPRSEGSTRLAALLPSLPAPAQRAGLLVALLAARADAEQHARVEAERMRLQAEAERRRQAEAEAERRRQAEAERRRLAEARAAAARSRRRRRLLVVAAVLLVLVGTGSYALIRYLAPPPDESILRLRHTDNVDVVAWSPDGALLATGGRGDAMQIWDPGTGQLVRALTGDYVVRRAAWAPAGAARLLVCCGSSEDTLATLLWDADTGELRHTLVGVEPTWSPDGVLLSTRSPADDMQIWSATSGEAVRRVGPVFNGAATWSPDGTRMAVYDADGHIQIYAISSGALVRTLAPAYNFAVPIWSPDGAKIASEGTGTTCNTDGCLETATIWDSATGKVLQTLTVPINTHGVTWSPDGTKLIVGDHVWSVSTGELLYRQAEFASAGGTLVWSPDGTRIAGAPSRQRGEDAGAIRVWDAATGVAIDTLTGHTDTVQMVAWSPDGAHLASGSLDRTARIWNAPPAP